MNVCIIKVRSGGNPLANYGVEILVEYMFDNTILQLGKEGLNGSRPDLTAHN